MLLGGELSELEAAVARRDYLRLPLRRHLHHRLMPRVLELRHKLTAYDATYVALAERLGAALVTTDEALARAAREHAALEVLAP